MTRPAGGPAPRWAARVAVVVLAVATAGCGVPGDSTPRAIGGPDASRPLEQATTTPTSITPTSQQVQVYLVERGLVLRAVPRDAASGSAADRVRALLAIKLDPAEQTQGLGSRIPSDTELLDGTRMEDGTFYVDLSQDFANVTGEGQLAAVAQIVYTATEAAEVTKGIRFQVEGNLYAVPGENGDAQDRPLRRSDFPSFNPRVAASTTVNPTTTTTGPNPH